MVLSILWCTECWCWKISKILSDSSPDPVKVAVNLCEDCRSILNSTQVTSEAGYSLNFIPSRLKTDQASSAVPLKNWNIFYILIDPGCPTFFAKRAASVSMTVKWATSLRIVRKYTLPQSSIFFWFWKWNSKFWIREEQSSSPLQGKTLKTVWKWERCVESSEHTVSGTDSRKKTVLKYEILVLTNLTVSGFIVFSSRMLRDTESEGGAW